MSRLHLRPILIVLLLWFAGLGAAGQFAKIAVAFAEYRALYPEAEAGVGWLLSIVSVVGMVFGLIAGLVSARFGYVRLLILGLLTGAAMSFWQAQLPGFPAMLASRLIEGISQLIIVVVAPTLIAQFSSDRFRGAAMALWSTFFAVSFAVMAWVGIPFMALHGLDGLLWAHGVFMVTLAGCLAGVFRVFPAEIARVKSPLGPREILRQHISTYTSAHIAAPAIGWLFYTLTFVSLLAIIPTMLPAGKGAVLVGFLPMISIGTSLVLVPVLLNLVSATKIVTIGFALAALVVLLAVNGLPPRYGWGALFAVLGLIQGGSFSAVVQLNITPRDRAMANGAMAQTGNMGNALGTPVLLAILGAFGVQGMLFVVAGLYGAGAMAHVLLARKRHG